MSHLAKYRSTVMCCEKVSSIINGHYSENICHEEKLLVLISILKTFPTSPFFLYQTDKGILTHLYFTALNILVSLPPEFNTILGECEKTLDFEQ
jgi:hypothetical protein